MPMLTGGEIDGFIATRICEENSLLEILNELKQFLCYKYLRARLANEKIRVPDARILNRHTYVPFGEITLVLGRYYYYNFGKKLKSKLCGKKYECN